MSLVNIDFVNADLTREENGVFKFEGIPTSPLQMPRLVPFIRRPQLSAPCTATPDSTPFINPLAASITNISKSPGCPGHAVTDFNLVPKTIRCEVETAKVTEETQLQDGSGQKRKNVDIEIEEAQDELEIEPERCVNCGSEFDPAAEHLQGECKYHPGMPVMLLLIP